MNMILSIAAGGAIGALGRHYVGGMALALWGAAFPWGTLIVNIAGSFLMGVLAGIFAQGSGVSPEVRVFLTVGFLGAFTTFSAFSLDVVTLYERGDVMAAGIYVGASVMISVLALVAGLYLVRMVSV
jgi:CrcB protein